MSAPPPEARRPAAGDDPPERRPWYARTGLVFGALGLTVLLTILLTPSQREEGDRRLTTLSRSPYATRVLADLAQRLGWRVERDSAVPGRGPLPADRVYAVLAPAKPLTAREYSRLLDAVRRGAGLLVVHPGGGPLEDTLGIERSSEGARMRVPAVAARDCPAKEPRYALNWGSGDVYSQWIVPKRALPADTVHWLPVMRPLTTAERRERGIGKDDVESSTWADPEWVEGRMPRFGGGDAEEADEDDDQVVASPSTTTGGDAPRERRRSRRDSLIVQQRVLAPSAIGMPLGRGRLILVADADWLRNDVLRVCRWHAAVTSVRMLEWLAQRPGGALPRHVVFDEWHQGRGTHASALGALGAFVVSHPIGRALAVGVVSLLVLLAALAARPLVPAARARIERRSPFEHVGALARAYEEVGATRVVTRRLVRGLRRRLGGTAGARDEESLLDALQTRHPALAPEVALVRDALERPVAPAALLDVGRAVATIERTILRA